MTESELLLRRVNDSVILAQRNGCPQYIGFLTPAEATACLSELTGQNYCFYGGYTDAERVFLGIYPEDIQIRESDFPIKGITFTYRKQDILSHRDVLGSLMALGIKRETVGDILVEDGRTVVFLNKDILKYVVEQIDVIGKTGVKILQTVSLPLPQSGQKILLSATVASARLDCVIAALISKSRSAAEEIISDSRVTVNSFVCEKVTRTVNEGDKISVRGFGKYTVRELHAKTKKGRIVLQYETYK